MSTTLIGVCPVCGNTTLSIQNNEETHEKERICSECHYENRVQVSKHGAVNQDTLCFLQFFGNSYKHVVANNEIKTLADAERKIAEVEQINGIEFIEIAVHDKELNKTIAISSKMPQR